MRRLVACAALLAAVVGIWAYLRYVGAIPGDERLFGFLRGHGIGTKRNQLTNVFSDMGTAPVALVTVVIAALVVGRGVSLRAAVLVLAASAGVLFNDVLRDVLGPTPSPSHTFSATAESYPSGHVVYVTTLFGVLAWLGWRHGRRDASLICLGLIVAMGPARVMTGSHLPSDVVGGYALGAAWLLAVLAVLMPNARSR